MSLVKPPVAPPSNKIIQSFWTGLITDMERLCIKSYLDNGHEFHLYTYESLAGLPAGTTVRDANEVIPHEQMEKFANPQQFADHFRYVLLYEKGGWWMDMDTVCLRPFDFKEDYVFALSASTSIVIPNGYIKVPAKSPLMAYCLQNTANVHKNALAAMDFQQLGPILITRGIRELGLERFVLPCDTFDPVHWDRAEQIIDPDIRWDLTKSYCVHLFHAMWNRGHEAHHYAISPDTNGTYPEGCLYERLKQRHILAPKVSIVITTFNRPELLEKTLGSFAMQDYTNYEVIVVDDGTDTDTRRVCMNNGATYIKLRDTTEPRNPAYANNVGIKYAKGEIILLQNAECQHVDPHSIERLANTVTDTTAVFARVMGLKQDGNRDWLYCGIESPRPFFFCGAIKKSWFEKLRGMDEDYPCGGYDDDDFADRLTKAGVRFVFTDVLVYHQWHSRAGMPSADAAGYMYQSKKAQMFAGTISEVRNLDREWGSLDASVIPVKPKNNLPTIKIAPAVIPALPPPTSNGLRYSNNGLTLDWWDMNRR